MAFERMEEWARSEILPSWFTNALQDRIGPLTNLRLRQGPGSNTVRVGDTADIWDDAVVLNIEGRWRMLTIPVNRAVAGAAGTYNVYAVAKNNDIRMAPAPFSDFTDYQFDLRVGLVPPALVLGTIDVVRKIGEVGWDGAAITSLKATVGPEAGMPLDIEVDPLKQAGYTGTLKSYVRDGRGFVRGDLVVGLAAAGTLTFAAPAPASLRIAGVGWNETDGVPFELTVSAAGALVAGQPGPGDTIKFDVCYRL